MVQQVNKNKNNYENILGKIEKNSANTIKINEKPRYSKKVKDFDFYLFLWYNKDVVEEENKYPFLTNFKIKM